MAPDRWSNDKIIELLDMYEKHECLWNVKSIRYRNRQARDAAYEILLKKLAIPGFTVNDLKNKIKGIRTTYAQEKNKIFKRNSGDRTDPEDVYKPHLKWFDRADSFLKTVVICRANTANAKDNYDDNEITQENNLEESEISDTEIEQAQNNKCNLTEPVSKNVQNNRRLFLKRKRNSSTVHVLQKTRISKASSDEDEFQIFGKLIASQLKQLPLHRALYCEEKIQAIIRQERLLEIYNGQPPQSSTCKITYSPGTSPQHFSNVSTPSEDPSFLDSKNEINVDYQKE